MYSMAASWFGQRVQTANSQPIHGQSLLIEAHPHLTGPHKQAGWSLIDTGQSSSLDLCPAPVLMTGTGP